MARIAKYSFDSEVTADDFVIGSDSINKRTKNYRLGDLADFLGTQQAVLGDKFMYQYKRDPLYKDLQSTQISFATNYQVNTLFSDISVIYIHPVNGTNVNIISFLEKVRDGGMLKLVNKNRVTDFGIYRVQEIDTIQNGVLELVVDLQLGNGYLNDDDYVGILANAPADKTHKTDELSGDVWQIQHNLGKFPSVSVVDTSNNIIYGEVNYNDENNITITFASLVTGRAYLN
jgi:hypothetical protein